jgi:hypothetical protein
MRASNRCCKLTRSVTIRSQDDDIDCRPTSYEEYKCCCYEQLAKDEDYHWDNVVGSLPSLTGLEVSERQPMGLLRSKLGGRF